MKVKLLPLSSHQCHVQLLKCQLCHQALLCCELFGSRSCQRENINLLIKVKPGLHFVKQVLGMKGGNQISKPPSNKKKRDAYFSNILLYLGKTGSNTNWKAYKCTSLISNSRKKQTIYSLSLTPAST